jgi:hypothetical protein
LSNLSLKNCTDLKIALNEFLLIVLRNYFLTIQNLYKNINIIFKNKIKNVTATI